MALAMLAKGPVAPLLAALVIIIYAVSVRELRIIRDTAWWLSAFSFFLAIALPWYAAVQARTLNSSTNSFSEQNLARFSENLYHHVEPFWYYLPITLLALVPWTIFAVAAFAGAIPAMAEKKFWRRRPTQLHDFILGSSPSAGSSFRSFSFPSRNRSCPVIFLRFPRVSLLLVDYLQHHLKNQPDEHVPAGLAILHALLASAPIVPALLIAYLLTQRRLPVASPCSSPSPLLSFSAPRLR